MVVTAEGTAGPASTMQPAARNTILRIGCAPVPAMTHQAAHLGVAEPATGAIVRSRWPAPAFIVACRMPARASLLTAGLRSPRSGSVRLPSGIGGEQVTIGKADVANAEHRQESCRRQFYLGAAQLGGCREPGACGRALRILTGASHEHLRWPKIVYDLLVLMSFGA